MERLGEVLRTLGVGKGFNSESNRLQGLNACNPVGVKRGEEVGPGVPLWLKAFCDKFGLPLPTPITSPPREEAGGEEKKDASPGCLPPFLLALLTVLAGVAAEQKTWVLRVRTTTLAELLGKHYGKTPHRATVWRQLKRLEALGLIKYIPERRQLYRGRWVQLPSQIILLDKFLRAFKGLVRLVANTACAFPRVAISFKRQVLRRMEHILPRKEWLAFRGGSRGRGILEALTA